MATQENNDERIALLQGTLDLLIQALVLGPCHGQGVARLIQRQSEEVFFVKNHGSLYLALQRLEDKKWITAKWGAGGEQPQGQVLLADETKGREQLVAKTASGSV